MRDFEIRTFVCGTWLPANMSDFLANQSEQDQSINDYIRSRNNGSIDNRKLVVNVETKTIPLNDSLHILKVVTSYFK